MSDNNQQPRNPNLGDLANLPSDLLSGDVVKQALNMSSKFAGEFEIRYQTALDLVVDKLKFIDRSYQLEHDVKLIDSLQHRIKTLESIMEKIQRKGLMNNPTDVRNKIRDIAGVRVITKFLTDIETVHQLIKDQPDIEIVQEKDYIRYPKPNGYQSLHLIVEVPIYLSTGTERIPVEIQIRTIAMNFWASLEHELNYKKDVDNKEQLRDDLRRKADDITKLDVEMDQIRQKLRK